MTFTSMSLINVVRSHVQLDDEWGLFHGDFISCLACGHQQHFRHVLTYSWFPLLSVFYNRSWWEERAHVFREIFPQPVVAAPARIIPLGELTEYVSVGAIISHLLDMEGGLCIDELDYLDVYLTNTDTSQWNCHNVFFSWMGEFKTPIIPIFNCYHEFGHGFAFFCDGCKSAYFVSGGDLYFLR